MAAGEGGTRGRRPGPDGFGGVSTPVLAACLVALAIAAGTASPAVAKHVRANDAQFVVKTKAGSAVIDRDPFRISFYGKHRGLLLQEVPNARLGPVSLPPTVDPEPFGLERQPDNATYAPLGFEVGSEFRDQWNSGLWTGNMLLSRRQGTVYSARQVISAQPAGKGVQLTVASSDPSRNLVVTVSP